MQVELGESAGRIDDSFIQDITDTSRGQKERENKLITDGINESSARDEDDDRPAVVAGQYKPLAPDPLGSQAALLAELLRNNIEVMTRSNPMTLGNLAERPDAKLPAGEPEANRLVVEVLRQIDSRDIFRKIDKWMREHRYSDAQLALVASVIDIARPRRKPGPEKKKNAPRREKEPSSPEASGRSDTEDALAMHTEALPEPAPLSDQPSPPAPPAEQASPAPAEVGAMEQEAVNKSEDEESANLRKLEAINKERLRTVDKLLADRQQPPVLKAFSDPESPRPADAAPEARQPRDEPKCPAPDPLLVKHVPNPRKPASQDFDSKPAPLSAAVQNAPQSNAVVRKEPLKAASKPDLKAKPSAREGVQAEAKPAVQEKEKGKLDKAAFEQKYGSITLPEKKKSKVLLEPENKRTSSTLLTELIGDIEGTAQSKQPPKKKQSPSKKPANGNTFSDEDSSKSGEGKWSDEDRSRSREHSPSRKKPSIVLESLTPQETRRFNRLESLTRGPADPFLANPPGEERFSPMIEPSSIFDPPET